VYPAAGLTEEEYEPQLVPLIEDVFDPSCMISGNQGVSKELSPKVLAHYDGTSQPPRGRSLIGYKGRSPRCSILSPLYEPHYSWIVEIRKSSLPTTKVELLKAIHIWYLFPGLKIYPHFRIDMSIYKVHVPLSRQS
jgi:hypothetical protein